MASTYIKLPPASGAGAVESVNGETGVVVLDAADVGAATEAYVDTSVEDLVTGPASSTDNNFATFDSTTGKIVQDSGFTAPAADGSPGSVLITDGDAVTSFQRSDFPKYRSRLLADFFEGSGLGPIAASFNGDGNFSATTAVNYANHPGIARHSLGTGSANYSVGYGGLVTPGKDFIFEAIINPLDLSTGAEEYEIWVGLGNTLNGTVFTNGFYFKYQRTTSVNWLMCTCAATNETATASSIAVTAGANTWQKLTIVCNEARTTVSYYVDDVLAGTVTTNIPAATDYTYPMVKTVKTAGTTDRIVYTDLIDLDLGVTR